jgi:microcystin-dependent protein
MSFSFPPSGWAQCNGQLMGINQNQALFALLGTTYGGDGRVTFGLPNLIGRVPIAPNGTYPLGTHSGEVQHTLVTSEIPTHQHFFGADGTQTGATAADPTNRVIGPGATVFNDQRPALDTALAASTLAPAGGNTPHNNMQPYLVINFCIALQGVFPSRT